ncbi:hypothetical protein [Pantoea sp. NGS-ED-1003]|uniref:hypothetical protein n=1 Tax=Pantoea sp. NGS-ED-1003 TaxID=1526743 RepID=UPI0005351EC0|nr:hypothetical protein [Pantoea sp. NGS-ED-1003]
MAKRGQLTEKIKAVASELLGKEITQAEIRLMPYVQHCLMNGQVIDPNRINSAEREILSDWRKLGFIEGGASGLGVTKEFWDAISDILWLGYVAWEDEDGE